jgi:hypothetical protein
MKYIYILSLALCCSFFASHAQTAESIIEKHIEAHGGMDNWKAIKNMKITGQYTGFSVTKGFTTILARPNSIYSEFYMGVHPVTIGYNGSEAWTINPWYQISYPRSVNAAEENVIKQKAEFVTSLFHYKEEGYKAEYKGKTTVEGEEVLHIELTKPNGQVDTWYLNSETYLEYISKTAWADFGTPTELETFYSDFRKVGNVTMPFFVERSFSIRLREIQIEKVEFNIDLDTEIFELPKSEAMKQLKVLEGDWNVKLEALSRQGWYVADNTSSSIKYVENYNLLEEKIKYTKGFPLNVINNWTFDSDINKYRISSFNSFDSKMDIYEGEFEDGTFEYINAQGDSKRKYLIKDISDSSFIIEVSVSRDGGENWHLREKFSYSKKQ